MDKIPYVSEHYFWTRITGIENYPCAPTHSLPAKCSENLKDITQKRNLHLKMRWSWLVWAGFLLKLYTFSNFEAPFESCALTFQQRRSRCQLRFTICYKFQELEQVESFSLLCCDDQHTLPFLTGGIRKVHLSWLIRNIQESRIFWTRETLMARHFDHITDYSWPRRLFFAASKSWNLPLFITTWRYLSFIL